MNTILENNFLRVEIDKLGAEIKSIKNKLNIEYLWQGNPEFWKRQSPILFPIVGKLKNDCYNYNGKTYHMTQHGFARDNNFDVVEKTETEAKFVFTSNEETRKIYPFDFTLSVTYKLIRNNIDVSINVINTGKNNMYFSIGAHPGFNIPLLPRKEKFEDYYVVAVPRRKFDLMQINSDGLSGMSKDDPLDSPVQLSHDLFKNDAKIFDIGENKKSMVMLQSDKSDHGVSLVADDCQYIGFWSIKDADFVCLEPWWGIADTKDSNGILQEKKGIIELKNSLQFNSNFSIGIF
ncbi:aldose 1-epimerase family protein [Fructilactobacillus sanfranciscensis]|uniref:aldose 1-epimerase family protein n=1 Tax=Fructilactobacillus sanfranciscensis TaxID=1625 RepID=UPI0014568874|nr:aldose 1-epimerase family protein [Fructilactobacillus sanfranciscensis]